jgi:excisionase family DNA binding protein
MSTPITALVAAGDVDDSDGPAADWQRRATVPVDVAAELLGISRASAFRAVHRGQLPSIRLGRRIVIPTAGLRILLGLDS